MSKHSKFYASQEEMDAFYDVIEHLNPELVKELRENSRKIREQKDEPDE